MTRRKSPPSHVPDDQMPADVATLQAQLRLARSQNADLHRRLQPTPPPAPASPSTSLVPLGQRGPDGVASLDEDNARLRARLDKAKAVFRHQEQELAGMKQRIQQVIAAYEEERKARIKYEGEKAYWLDGWRKMRDQAEDLEDQLKHAGVEPRLNYQWLDRGPTLADVLTQLLQIAHPDKWSQRQPASQLAHELALVINQARTKLEGRL